MSEKIRCEDRQTEKERESMPENFIATDALKNETSSTDSSIMFQVFCFISTLTILYVMKVKGTQGKAVMFYENIAADTNECTKTHQPGSNRIVLRGQAHLPTQSNWTSYIIFDQKSDTSNDFKLLCLIDTRLQCESNTVSDICYCQPTQTEDTYQFVVNISTVTTEMSGLVRAYLMMKNSTSVFTQTSLSSWQESNSPVKTSLTINDEPVGDNCTATIHSKKLKIEANCTGMRGPCWLELTTGHNSTPAVGNRHIFFEHSVESDSNVTVVLSRSRCNKENFQEMYRCQITIMTSMEVSEASTNTAIIGAIVGAVLVPLGVIIIIISVVVYKKKLAQREKQDHGNDTDTQEKENDVVTTPLIYSDGDTQGNSPTETATYSEIPSDHRSSFTTSAGERVQVHCTIEIENQKDADSSTQPVYLADSRTWTSSGNEGTQDYSRPGTEEQTPVKTFDQITHLNIPEEFMKRYSPVMTQLKATRQLISK
ncbi:uncharacterized protein LOC106069966 isoform X2 [Biomphalaria glabrata]|uniref:Uncharacterized protein LOC106069966 isoform X2 n=1 Tax=Biomphalaria glabrata TaxID=6526 RepID=A0A9W2YS14_BIOGL|nr:uncharacterized protein LOC106069966 isoform X2 [Biomphalaria glabrata]